MLNKYRDPMVRADVVADAWESVAPDAMFAGLTLAQYRNRVKPSQDARDVFASLRGQARAQRGEISRADAATSLATKQVVSAVRADPVHGSDSPLLAAMDYVTDSQRKSGLTRKSNGNGNGTETAPVAPVTPEVPAEPVT